MISKNKTGLALGLFVGLVHLVWSLLILVGWAGPLLNFIYTMHSISVPITILPFDLGRSIGLILLTGFIGYIVGNIFASIWNKVHK